MAINYYESIKKINEAFDSSCDIRQLEFFIGNKPISVYFIDGFVDRRVLEDYILLPLKELDCITPPYYTVLNEKTIMTTPIVIVDDIQETIELISEGEIIIVIDGAEGFFQYSEKGFPMRGVVEPPVNSVLRGPREGFNEDIKTNMSLIRKRLYTKALKMEMLTVGKYTATKVAVMYIGEIADQHIVDKIVSRIKKINIDGIIESSYIARHLEENKHSLFSQVGASEKPDVIVGKMLEGRVAIVVDGSPAVLTLPFILFEQFQTAEDYYVKSFRASLIRLIRVIAAVISIILPGLYVAFLEYQYQLLPLRFLSSIIHSTMAIPLTPTLEMFVVLILFEILSEASIRMPRYVGMALSVVGAIVIGDTAVSAGLLSPPTILVTAISTIGMYCVPDEVNSMSVLRFLFTFVGGVLGVYGIILGIVGVICYLASLTNYGSAYLSPYAPSIIHDWQDGIIKSDLTTIKERGYSIKTHNRTRQK